MSIQLTKSHFEEALKDQDNKVIALSGRWGTGKSHLWDEIQKSSQDDSVRGAIYVSLFGLASMAQFKVKLVQSAIPVASNYPKIFEGIKSGVKATQKALEGINKGFAGFGALGELAMLMTPTILKNKLIVLDDIERKHEKLSVDELLGFIDEFTKQHGARIVLILNTDQLKDRPLWETFREKVIDVELKLETSAEEAFHIAIKLVPSEYQESIKKAVVACSLNNIRVICKVIRSVNRILDGYSNLSEALLARVIPSTVLLSAIHYRGIENGPPLEYVLENRSTMQDWVAFSDKNKPNEETVESKNQGRWKSLLSKLGIQHCDEYEILVVDYLESGLFERTAIDEIINRYIHEEDGLVASNLANEFIQGCFWEHRLTEAELLERAAEILPIATKLTPGAITNLHSSIAELHGGEEVANAIVNAWVDAFKTKSMAFSDLDIPFQQEYHPAIKTAFDAKKAQHQANTSVLDVCRHVSEHRSWGTRHKLAMRNATAANFDVLLKTLPTADLKLLLYQMLDFVKNKSVYCNDFGAGMDQFNVACRNIVNAPDSGRLGKLIRILFEEANLSALLNVPDTNNQSESRVDVDV
jgi:hypothetical protein